VGVAHPGTVRDVPESAMPDTAPCGYIEAMAIVGNGERVRVIVGEEFDLRAGCPRMLCDVCQRFLGDMEEVFSKLVGK
jgi:hypothetical protein